MRFFVLPVNPKNTVNILFGYIQFAADSIILYGIAILLFILLAVSAYAFGDKIERRNLELINQKPVSKNEN